MEVEGAGVGKEAGGAGRTCEGRKINESPKADTRTQLSHWCEAGPSDCSCEIQSQFLPQSSWEFGVNKTVSSRITPTRAHKGFSVTFGKQGSITSILQRLQPRIYISEQVPGFATPYDKRDSASPKTDFVRDVMSPADDQGTPLFTKGLVFKLPSSNDRPVYSGK